MDTLLKATLVVFIHSATAEAQAQSIPPELYYSPPYNEYHCIDQQQGQDGAFDWKVCHTTHDAQHMTIWLFKANTLKRTCLHETQYIWHPVNGIPTRFSWAKPTCTYH